MELLRLIGKLMIDILLVFILFDNLNNPSIMLVIIIIRTVIFDFARLMKCVINYLHIHG